MAIDWRGHDEPSDHGRQLLVTAHGFNEYHCMACTCAANCKTNYEIKPLQYSTHLSDPRSAVASPFKERIMVNDKLTTDMSLRCNMAD